VPGVPEGVAMNHRKGIAAGLAKVIVIVGVFR
jgi:hypothetical protein